MPQHDDLQDDNCFNQLKACLINSFSCFFNSRRHEYQEIPEMPIPVKKNSDMLLSSKLAPKRTSCLRSNSTGGITGNSNKTSKPKIKFDITDKIFLIPDKEEYVKNNLHTKMWHSQADLVKIRKGALQDCVNKKFVFPSDEMITLRDTKAALDRQIPKAASLREILSGNSSLRTTPR
jgi:hypothetical protein